MGLGIVYIGGIRNDPQGVVEVLSLPELVYPVFGMCVGYPDQDPEIRPRPRMDLIYHENEYYSDQYDRGFAEYDQVMREYYRRRTKGGKDTTWTEQMAEKFARASRPHLRGFLEKQGFRFQ
jgi:FMN reductase (NADPH)